MTNKDLIRELRECIVLLQSIRSLSLDAKYILADRKLLGLHQRIEKIYGSLIKESGLTIEDILKEYVRPENNSSVIETNNDQNSN